MENNIKIHLIDINMDKNIYLVTPCGIHDNLWIISTAWRGKLFSIQFNNSQKAVYT